MAPGDAPPPPPPGFFEEPEAPEPAVRYEPGTLAPAPPPLDISDPAVAAALAKDESEMGPEADALAAEIAARRQSEATWVPGSTALDNRWKRHEARADADVPTEEANQASHVAGKAAELADDDRRAIEADMAHPAIDPARAAAIKARAEAVADDAINEGLAVSQDAVAAQAAYEADDPAGAQSADARAQADLGRVARDLAEADALRAEIEGTPPPGLPSQAPPSPPAPPT